MAVFGRPTAIPASSACLSGWQGKQPPLDVWNQQDILWTAVRVSALPAQAMAPPLGTGKEITSPIQRQAGRNGLCGGEPPRRGV